MKSLFISLILVLFAVNAAASTDKVEHLAKRYHIGPSIKATITAYTDDPRENNGIGNPVGTAMGTKVRPGIVAVSRDLLKSGWKLGDKLFIEGLGVFTIEDTMHARWRNRVDVAVAGKKDAGKIGLIRNRLVVLLKKKLPQRLASSF